MSWVMLNVPKGTRNIHGEETFDTVEVHAVYCDFCPTPQKRRFREDLWRTHKRNPALVIFDTRDIRGSLPDDWVELHRYPTSSFRALNSLKTIRHLCPLCVQQELPE